MKKIVLLLMLFVAFQVSAQNFHFIPKVGLNLANMTNVDGSVRPGLNIGIAAEMPITDVWSVEPGIYYSMQGTKISHSGIDYKAKLDYLNIPIYAKAYLYQGLYAFAGPQFGFNVRDKRTASREETTQNIDLKNAKTFDFAIGLGLGYQFAQGFLVSINYNIGLTKAWEFNDNNSHNGVWQFMVGYRF